MDRSAFYKYLRNNLTLSLSQMQVEGFEACLDEASRLSVSKEHLASILAEAWHETGGRMEPIIENLNYSADRITQVWPSRFHTLSSAKPYAHNPQSLANKVYGGRMGNNTVNDGWMYRGRGMAQITGKTNYTKFGIADDPGKAGYLDTSIHILFDGMIHGKFTGKKVSDYTYPDQYAASRAIINGDIKSNGPKIAKYGKIFQEALTSSGYK